MASGIRGFFGGTQYVELYADLLRISSAMSVEIMFPSDAVGEWGCVPIMLEHSTSSRVISFVQSRRRLPGWGREFKMEKQIASWSEKAEGTTRKF